MQLAGKVTAITGAASGIGLATARLFAREGAPLVLGDLDEEAGGRAAGEIEGSGGPSDAAREFGIGSAHCPAVPKKHTGTRMLLFFPCWRLADESRRRRGGCGRPLLRS